MPFTYDYARPADSMLNLLSSVATVLFACRQYRRMAEVDELVGASWQCGGRSRTIGRGKMSRLRRTGDRVTKPGFPDYRPGARVPAFGAPFLTSAPAAKLGCSRAPWEKVSDLFFCTGQIAPGLSADLILLDKNPLETVANLRTINAVMIRGIWLPEPEKLPFTGADIETKKRLPSRVELAAMVTLAEAHDAAGYAQSSMSLALWIALAEDLGERELANRLRTLDRY